MGLRSAAKQLARFTEEHIPNPTRRWARAMRHELDYVEGDWHAIGWSLGGLRLLLRHGFVPTPTPALLERQALLHGKLRRQAAERSLAGRLLNRANILVCGLLFIKFLNLAYPAHRLAVPGLALFCGGLLALLLSGLRRASGAIPEDTDTLGLLALYRTDLRRSTSRGSLLSFTLPALLVLTGTELLAPTLWVRMLGFIWLLVIVIYLQKYRANLVTLDALEQDPNKPCC